MNAIFPGTINGANSKLVFAPPRQDCLREIIGGLLDRDGLRAATGVANSQPDS